MAVSDDPRMSVVMEHLFVSGAFERDSTGIPMARTRAWMILDALDSLADRRALEAAEAVRGDVVEAAWKAGALHYTELDASAPSAAPPAGTVAAIPKKDGFYVASRASLPERGHMWRTFRGAGYPIISTWIDEDGPGQTLDFAELWERIAGEIARSAALVLYVEPDDFPLKGALVEVGMAINQGIPIFICMPGVKLEGTTSRPIGSWIRHPLVFEAPSAEWAMKMAAKRVPGWAPAPLPAVPEVRAVVEGVDRG